MVALCGGVFSMGVIPRVPGDYGFNGFFHLRDPHDLFKKLRHDYHRMIVDPLNVYAAYDFFVTVNHLVDWIWPSATRDQLRDIRASEATPRICEHLANGAKHFILNRKHAAVAQLESVVTPTFEIDEILADPAELALAWFDPEDGLVVTLEAAEASAAGLEKITAPALAKRVLLYWGKRMGYGDLEPTLPTHPVEAPA